MVQRLTYRRTNSYNTRSNKRRTVQTPGGVLRFLVTKKKVAFPKCADCKGRLIGLPSARPVELKHMAKNKKSVSRAYGGNRCASCTRQRIVRAFLVEERKIVKQVMKKSKKENKGKK